MISLTAFNLSLSDFKSLPTLNLKILKPSSIVSLSFSFILSPLNANHPALVVYAGTATLSKASCILSSLPFWVFFNNSRASSGVMASVIYLKSIQRTISSGVISATIFHTGLLVTLPHKSQMALMTAAVAR